MTLTAIKPWYKIKEGVEYSTDFNFFLENQIFVSVDGNKYSFNSRLQSQTFAVKQATYSDGNTVTQKVDPTGLGKFINVDTLLRYTYSQSKIFDICREIHSDILAGKHGEGIFVD